MDSSALNHGEHEGDRETVDHIQTVTKKVLEYLDGFYPCAQLGLGKNCYEHQREPK